MHFIKSMFGTLQSVAFILSTISTVLVYKYLRSRKEKRRLAMYSRRLEMRLLELREQTVLRSIRREIMRGGQPRVFDVSPDVFAALENIPFTVPSVPPVRVNPIALAAERY